MIDVEQVLREQLESFVPDYPPPDWSEVLERAGQQPSQVRRRRLRRLPIIALAALIVVAFTTPLGAAVIHGVGDFSTWLRGKPGSPASTSEQKAFEQANQRSWLHFPPNTQLRQLDSLVIPATGQHVDLLGFRAGTSLCLRVVITGVGRAQTQSCIPVATLRHASAPAEMVLVDHGFGKGTKRAWYGLWRYTAPALQVSAGIAGDEVRSVVLQDQAGKHIVKTHGNAFLYLAIAPEVGQRIAHVWAKTQQRLVPVPFAAAQFGIGAGRAPGGTLPGPTKVQRHLNGGTIGWLDRRQPVGDPLSKLSRRDRTPLSRNLIFGRILLPDPTRPTAVAVTLSKRGRNGTATNICIWLIRGNQGAGGGCLAKQRLFAHGPISLGIWTVGGSGQAATVSGVVSDNVARVAAFLSPGGTEQVPLRDNAFLVDIPRAKLPSRLVAYDNHGKIIGVSEPIFDDRGDASPARGKAHLLLTASDANGNSAALYVGPATNGRKCMYVRDRGPLASGTMIDCDPTSGGRRPLSLGTEWRQSLVFGAVAPQVATVVLHFAVGATQQVAPTQGFILTAVEPSHTRAGRDLVSASALAADRHIIAHQRLAGPPHR